MEERLEVRRTVLNITARCTLKCKMCVIGSPYFENPPHYEYDVIAKSIDKMFEIMDYIEWTEFSGGEPLIHKDLDRMVAKMMEYRDQFDKLLIMTNGTILPQGNLAEELMRSRDKILIMMSHYGELSCKAAELEGFCKANGLEIEIKKYYGEEQHFGGWIDYGDYHKYNRSEEELEKIYKNCGSTQMKGCFTTHGGQMHWCVPSARGMKLLKNIPDNPEEYIDLFDEGMTAAQQRAKVLRMQNRNYISACDYCVGTFGTDDMSKRVKAAEQLEGQEDRYGCRQKTTFV